MDTIIDVEVGEPVIAVAVVGSPTVAVSLGPSIFAVEIVTTPPIGVDYSDDPVIGVVPPGSGGGDADAGPWLVDTLPAPGGYVGPRLIYVTGLRAWYFLEDGAWSLISAPVDAADLEEVRDAAEEARDKAALAESAASEAADLAALAATLRTEAGQYAGVAEAAAGLAASAQAAAEAIEAQVEAALGDAQASQADVAAMLGQTEAAKAAAEIARTASEVAKADAQTAADAADGSASASAGSASAASASATDAGNAASAAQAAQVSAESASGTAGGHASAAASSASTAATHAGNAGQSASAANSSKVDAQTAAGAASTSASQAAQSKTDAAGSASQASTSQQAAATSATNAGNSATAAAGSASTASTKATEAGQSATAANTSKVAAETAAGNASTSAGQAAQSKTDAAGSASAASTSAGAAAGSATAAGGSATAAAGSASTAGTHATNAGNSATAANTAKVEAQSALNEQGRPNLLSRANATVAGGTQVVDLAWGKSGWGLRFVGTGAMMTSTFQGLPTLKVSTPYSVSFRARLTAGSPLGIILDFYPDDLPETTRAIGVADTLYKWEGVSSASGNMPAAFFRIFNSIPVGATLEITDIKLEEGATATGWTPASREARDYANAAAGSASSASTSATNAGQSATAAQTAKTAAETASGNASTSASQASQSKTDAAGSASAAATSAGAAAQSRTDAGNSASAAATSAQTATTKATEAGQSASAASQSQTAAAGSAGAAATSAGTASTQASNASGSAAAALASQQVAARLSNGVGCFADPMFATSPIGTGSLPVGWTTWSTNGTFAIEGGGLYGTRCFRLANAAGARQHGARIHTNTPSAWIGPKYLNYYVVEVDLERVSGDLRGSGVYIDGSGASGYIGGGSINFATELGATPATGRIHSIRRVLACVPGQVFTYQNAYLMCDWDGLHGSSLAKDIRVYRFQIRPATVEEIRSFNVASEIAAAVTVESSARATAIGSIEAKYGVKVDVNGYVSGFGLLSTANGAVPTSIFSILADKFQIALPGVSGGSPKQIFEIGAVDGVPTLVFKGNIVSDEAITTRGIAANAVNEFLKAYAVGSADLVVGGGSTKNPSPVTVMQTLAFNLTVPATVDIKFSMVSERYTPTSAATNGGYQGENQGSTANNASDYPADANKVRVFCQLDGADIIPATIYNHQYPPTDPAQDIRSSAVKLIQAGIKLNVAAGNHTLQLLAQTIGEGVMVSGSFRGWSESYNQRTIEATITKR